MCPLDIASGVESLLLLLWLSTFLKRGIVTKIDGLSCHLVLNLFY